MEEPSIGLRPLEPPAFIVGCGHSGTSLLLAILGAHSRIHAIPYESKFGSGNEAEARALFAEFDRAAISSGKHRWVEKTPRHIHCLEQILEWHPNGRVLLIVRDGRDVACSIRDRTGSLRKGIQRWVQDNLAGRPYWTHPNVLLLKYEDLIEDFDLSVKKVTDFLGEPYEEGMKQYHREPLHFYSETIERPPTAFGKNHRKYRNWQINQPLFDGRGRWKQLTESELAMISDQGDGLLRELGYGGE